MSPRRTQGLQSRRRIGDVETGRARRAAVASLALAAPLLLAGCGAGEDAQTQRVYSPADGVRTDAGDLSLLNALIVVPPAPTGGADETDAGTDAETDAETDTDVEETQAEETPAEGAPAPGEGAGAAGVLSVTIANRSGTAETFTGLQGQDVGESQVAGPTEIAPNGVLRVGTGEGATTVTIGGVKQRAGGFVDLRFSFARAGVIQLKVPVVEATGDYASVTPTAGPTSSAPATSAEPESPSPAPAE